jgi:hypothetical protein
MSRRTRSRSWAIRSSRTPSPCIGSVSKRTACCSVRSTRRSRFSRSLPRRMVTLIITHRFPAGTFTELPCGDGDPVVTEPEADPPGAAWLSSLRHPGDWAGDCLARPDARLSPGLSYLACAATRAAAGADVRCGGRPGGGHLIKRQRLPWRGKQEACRCLATSWLLNPVIVAQSRCRPIASRRRQPTCGSADWSGPRNPSSDADPIGVAVKGPEVAQWT